MQVRLLAQHAAARSACRMLMGHHVQDVSLAASGHTAEWGSSGSRAAPGRPAQGGLPAVQDQQGYVHLTVQDAHQTTHSCAAASGTHEASGCLLRGMQIIALQALCLACNMCERVALVWPFGVCHCSAVDG